MMLVLSGVDFGGRPPTLRASDNSSAVQSNVHTGDRLIMTLQLVFQLKSSPGSSIELNSGVSCNSQRLLVSREGVVGDGMVEEVVDFWSGHIAD